MKKTPVIPLLKFQGSTLPFKVQTINSFFAEQDDTQEVPHSHNYYEMIWLTNGSGTLHVDMQECPVDPHSIFCLKPNQPHQFKIRDGMDGFVISFMDSFFRMDEYDFDWICRASLSQLFTEGRPTRVSPDEEEDMKEIVLKMLKEFANEYTYRVELLRRYFKIFLIYLTRRFTGRVQPTEQTRETELLQNFKQLLDKNFKEQKMVAEYAEQLFVSPNYLNRIVKKYTGSSAGHHIRQRVVLEAKRMGRYSGAGLKEIAYDLGFLDPAHFSRFFKTFAGMNFSKFKSGALVVPLDPTPNRV